MPTRDERINMVLVMIKYQAKQVRDRLETLENCVERLQQFLEVETVVDPPKRKIAKRKKG